MPIPALLINGPNMNLLGGREPDKYGTETLAKVIDWLREYANTMDIELRCIQSNHEGTIVDAIQDNADWAKYLIINPAAYTHTSVAIRDAIIASGIKTIEVHMSNIYRREPFRQHSFVAPVAIGQVSGFGKFGYLMALYYISALASETAQKNAAEKEGTQ